MWTVRLVGGISKGFVCIGTWVLKRVSVIAELLKLRCGLILQVYPQRVFATKIKAFTYKNVCLEDKK